MCGSIRFLPPTHFMIGVAAGGAAMSADAVGRAVAEAGMPRTVRAGPYPATRPARHQAYADPVGVRPPTLPAAAPARAAPAQPLTQTRAGRSSSPRSR